MDAIDFDWLLLTNREFVIVDLIFYHDILNTMPKESLQQAIEIQRSARLEWQRVNTLENLSSLLIDEADELIDACENYHLMPNGVYDVVSEVGDLGYIMRSMMPMVNIGVADQELVFFDPDKPPFSYTAPKVECPDQIPHVIRQDAVSLERAILSSQTPLINSAFYQLWESNRAFCKATGIDFDKAVELKMVRNSVKYPDGVLSNGHGSQAVPLAKELYSRIGGDAVFFEAYSVLEGKENAE